jgi:hypothetical protein
VIDSIECRLMRQLRSASAAPTLFTWRTVSPSAKVMVDPRNGARAVIRDTGLDGGRYLWSVLAAGEMDPMSDGRTDDLARAQAAAEAALRAYAGNLVA